MDDAELVDEWERLVEEGHELSNDRGHYPDGELYNDDGDRYGPWCEVCRQPWPCFTYFTAHPDATRWTVPELAT